MIFLFFKMQSFFIFCVLRGRIGVPPYFFSHIFVVLCIKQQLCKILRTSAHFLIFFVKNGL